MTTLPLHPALVHVPLGLAFVLPLVALGLTVALWRRKLPRAAFGVLVGLQAVLLGAGIVGMQLGERDEDRVERVVPERFIEAHEERAEAFVWAAGAVLAGAVAVLVIPAGAATAVAALVTAGTLGVAALGFAAGEAGGELVYRHGAATAFLPGAAPGADPTVASDAPPGPVRAAHHDDD